MRRAVAVLAALVLLVTVDISRAQDDIPNGVVVRDPDGVPWVILDGQRYHLAVYPADAAMVSAIPSSDQWATVSLIQGWVIGSQPDWANSTPGGPIFAPPAPSPEQRQPEAPVTFDGGRAKSTDPFVLAGGHYKIRWTASAETPQGCFHGARLTSIDSPQRSYDGGSGDVKSSPTSGETAVYNVPAGRYYFEVISGCSRWHISIQPL